MKDFETKLHRLETLGDEIKKNNVSLNDALDMFEEGIQLARGMEKELEKIEGKVQQLMNQPELPKDKPTLELFPEINN
ncbi:MAG TPA: exodeoxyribonuclease VII small subunit [Treponemataceae bacterium]|nr:exodeoxyribonuclease VII small subunit [Treponemataceae bacterium]